VPACIVNINGGDRLAAEFLKPHEQFVISDNSSSATGRPPILASDMQIRRLAHPKPGSHSYSNAPITRADICSYLLP
jgi:hypothetical protein